MRRYAIQSAIVLLAALVSVGRVSAQEITATDWGLIDGKPVKLYTLKNANGLILKVTNYGAIITQLHVPDRNGKLADVVLGFDSLDGYIAGHPHFGALVGRVANRIAKGRFSLEGKTYQLALNDYPNHLHGGAKGFDLNVWDAEPQKTAEGPAIRLSRTSLDGEENYPGQVRATVTYVLTDKNELKVEMTATTDKTTIVNLAQHTYWNLAGQDSGDILGHELTLNADRYTPVDATLIPTGLFAPVAGTPFDFRQPKPIGRDLQAAGGKPIGFDHNFVLNGEPAAMKLAARVYEPKSGRQLELFCDKPGLQFYTGNFLDGKNVGKGGAVYKQYNGLCLETQNYPDSIHHADWPSIVLRPGETYRHVMVARFSTR